MLSEETKQLFLAAYKELCLKYGVVVDSCGCCDSPFLARLNNLEDYCRSSYKFSKKPLGIESHIEHLENNE